MANTLIARIIKKLNPLPTPIADLRNAMKQNAADNAKLTSIANDREQLVSIRNAAAAALHAAPLDADALEKFIAADTALTQVKARDNAYELIAAGVNHAITERTRPLAIAALEFIVEKLSSERDAHERQHAAAVEELGIAGEAASNSIANAIAVKIGEANRHLQNLTDETRSEYQSLGAILTAAQYCLGGVA
ncbi:MAG TPA: hypothetical protein VFC07_05915 [Verrucomicrobiae bacterium]|nr:hypothetical protein [Verrucomicrobiae bacterium]